MSRTEAVLWVLLMSRTPAEAAIYGAEAARQSRGSSPVQNPPRQDEAKAGGEQRA